MDKKEKENFDFKEIKKNEEKLKKELKFCQEERDEYLNGWKREKANFLNYKKEESEKIKEIVDYSTENLILEILPIIDNFDLAFEKINEKTREENDFVKGFFQIKSFFESFLKDQGVEEIECLGKPFDPHFHEAVEITETEKKEESGIIVKEIRKGYMIKNKLLRPSKVRVTK